ALRDSAGRVEGGIGCLVDLSTPFPQMQAELARKAKELERSNAELEQFAYVASHDLQEPLRMIRGYLGLLEKAHAQDFDEKSKDFMRFAMDGADRMQRMIKDVLAYSRVSDSTAQLVIVPAQDAIAEAMANLRTKIDENAAVITCGDLPEVMFDRLHLVQIFQNLMSNAITYRSAEPPAIAISAVGHAHEWEFIVRDNGIGIDPEHQQKIFKIFQRLHSRTEYPGSGIGLAICKKSIERWGGRIWVSSAPARGSEFHFTIPRHDI
nr:hypothetical protein [Planctomycetota bacterium]